MSEFTVNGIQVSVPFLELSVLAPQLIQKIVQKQEIEIRCNMVDMDSFIKSLILLFSQETSLLIDSKNRKMCKYLSKVFGNYAMTVCAKRAQDDSLAYIEITLYPL
jgi:hypothetical protein